MRTVGGHPHRLFAAVAAAALVLLAAACGSGDSKTSSSPTNPGDTGPLPSGAPADTLLIIAGPDATHDVLESALELGSVKRYVLTGRSMDAASFDGLSLAGDEQIWGVQPAAPAAQAEAFNAAFEATYGYTATDFPGAAFAYDSVYVIALAAVAANSSAGAAIRDNLFFVANSPGALAVYGVDGFTEAAELVSGAQQDVNYIGASGQVDMAADGGSSKGAVQTWRIINGQIVPIETRDVDLAAEVGTEVPQGARVPAAEPPGEPLTIGIIVSDDDAGTALQDAAQLAVDEINDAGGVLGDAIELAVQTLGEVEAGEAARVLIEDSGADAIVGPVEAGAVTAALATALDAEVPLVALSAAPELAAIESAGLLFRPVPAEALEMPVLANLALEMESRNVCVLYEAGPAGEVMAEAFRKAIEFKEAAVRGIESFVPGESDLAELLQTCIGS